MKILSLALVFSLLFGTTVALAASTDASYFGGTVAEFKDAKDEVRGHLETSDETNLEFVYKDKQVVKIPYANFIDMEYGQKSGRRRWSCGDMIPTAWTCRSTCRSTVSYLEKAEPLSYFGV